jgi:hypothetical protein
MTSKKIKKVVINTEFIEITSVKASLPAYGNLQGNAILFGEHAIFSNTK